MRKQWIEAADSVMSWDNEEPYQIESSDTMTVLPNFAGY